MGLTSAGVFRLHFHTGEVSSSPQEENTQRVKRKVFFFLSLLLRSSAASCQNHEMQTQTKLNECNVIILT